ncbi:polysaccharide deacetylase family protein [Kitasatospora sp. NPDC049285]|uniref:polysaccharide deacetylase family protein n=1 Tax=Kitasatospora sp. NPDC049285 TaxID=3157096 RepID=UPI003418EAFD
MLERRRLFGAVLGLATAGCAAPATRTDQPSATPPASSAPASAAPPGASSSAPPDRAAVVARYAGLAPAQWGTEVTGVRTTTSGTALALTFDACGGPGGDGYDAELIGVLRRLAVPATLFLNARWIDANPGPFHELAADPLFELGNHGTAHRPLSVTGRAAYGITGTADAGAVYDEVAGNHAKLTALLGRPPRYFRSGTAHYDEIATRIVADLGEGVAGFSVNGDAGATFTAEQVRRTVAAAGPGAIVIGHVNHPGSGTAPGFAAALPALLDAGRRFRRLSDD